MPEMRGPVPSYVFASGLLAGRVILVTGGGSNLGRAAAGELAARGAQVVIAGRRDEVLAEACAAIGPTAHAVPGDIRREEDAERIVPQSPAPHRRVGGLGH